MRLTRVRLSGFQSFGAKATCINFESVTFLVGPNGSGKTAILQALSRLFGLNPRFRGICKSDFHVDNNNEISRTLWIEAQFDFPELCRSDGEYSTIPDHFKHMRMVAVNDESPRLRIRLTATLAEDDEIDEVLRYVIEADEDDEPVKEVVLPRYDRTKIQVHYLPARRDPSDHISYGSAALLGRILRAADWSTERSAVQELANTISETLLGQNAGVVGLSERLAAGWSLLHHGTHYADPNISFQGSNIDLLLRNLSIGFSPGHGESSVDYTRLSDGQQSLLYLSLVICAQRIHRDVLSGKLTCFDVGKLRPPTFSMIVMEEPENSLSPHYLGRIVQSLNDFASSHDAQAIVATHAPSLLRRVPPGRIRYIRLDVDRQSTLRSILLPKKEDEAYKYVKEAVQAYPELYFARLVILGEGDSEEIVIPRLLQAIQHGVDDSSIVVAPLGGRHVNHFWRLLNGLDIPHITLLDLDLGRHGGGWGRIHYAMKQIQIHKPASQITDEHLNKLPKWDSDNHILTTNLGKDFIRWLELDYNVFFSAPLDLDSQWQVLFGAPTVLGNANWYRLTRRPSCQSWVRVRRMPNSTVPNSRRSSLTTIASLSSVANQSRTLQPLLS